MGKIVKNKNIVEFWIDGKTKPYVLDINANTLTGLRGAPLVNIPSQVMSLARFTAEPTNVIKLIYEGVVPRSDSDIYSVADKLDALGHKAYVSEMRSLCGISYEFKDLAQFLAEDPNNSVRMFIEYQVEQLWANRKGLPEVDEHFTANMRHMLYRNFTEEAPEVLKRFAYYLTRGLWEFCNADSWRVRDYFRDYLNWCTALEMEMEKGDFFRLYINAKRNYERNKNAILSKGIYERQTKRMASLAFENEDFCVVVPLTNEELIAEGNSQGNCVGGYGERICKGYCNVVFIRSKHNIDKSYITCEINANGVISQYLTHFNNRVENDKANEFRYAYQQFLYTHWGE
jgi:hypothetical protein